jgi:A nuclease of the HNH/ENDO VII superfamily with conserved WHH
MENQINVGAQRQPYEPFEQADSETENSGAEASLAGDSAGANTSTSGDPDIAQPQIESESVNPAPPEASAASNTFNRYGIGDTVILGRPEYALNDRATIAETAEATPAENAPIGAASNAKDTTNAPAAQRGTKLPLSDSAAFTAAREYGALHGFNAEQVDQVAAILAYYHCETPQDSQETLENLPFHISTIMQAVGGPSADGLYDVGSALRSLQEAQAMINGDPNAGNRNVPDGRADRGVDMMGVQQVGGPRGISRAGAGQGGEDYAREMTAASYSADTNYYDLGDDYSNESYEASNSYDTYDPAESSPQIDLAPLLSLPPVDSNGPMMLPEPVINLDHELPPLPNIGVQPEAERTPALQDADAALTTDITAPGIREITAPGDSTRGGSTGIDTSQGGGVSGNQPGNDTTVSDATADASRPLYGFNTDGQPLFSTGSKPPQGEYRAAPDAPNLMAGDPVLRADASGATPLRDENGTLYYRVNGGSMDGQIIYVQPTTPTAQNEKPATTLETGGTADRSGDFSLGLAPLATGSTAAARLAGQLASQVLAAEMEFGPPQLRVAAAATLTGVALWAAGRQNTEYEALSPEERDWLRQPLINVPPPPLPPLAGLVPPPVPDNSILPGTSTQPNNLPPLGGFQIAPPQTIDDFITGSSRLPASNGQWSGTPGNSDWTSSNSDVNSVTGGQPIPFRDGYPDFSQWSEGTFIFDNLTGQNSDFGMVYDAVANEYGLANRTEAQNFLRELGLTPHHVEDGRTIQLIPTALHNNIPHIGGASHLRNGG